MENRKWKMESNISAFLFTVRYFFASLLNSLFPILSLVSRPLSLFPRPLSLIPIPLLLFSLNLFAQNKYEDRRISDVSIAFEGRDKDVSAAEQFRLIARTAVGERYSTVKIREAIDALYKSKKIVSAQVEATISGENSVDLRFIIKRKTLAEKVYLRIGSTIGEPVTEEELLLKLNLLNAKFSTFACVFGVI